MFLDSLKKQKEHFWGRPKIISFKKYAENGVKIRKTQMYKKLINFWSTQSVPSSQCI